MGYKEEWRVESKEELEEKQTQEQRMGDGKGVRETEKKVESEKAIKHKKMGTGSNSISRKLKKKSLGELQ